MFFLNKYHKLCIYVGWYTVPYRILWKTKRLVKKGHIIWYLKELQTTQTSNAFNKRS